METIKEKKKAELEQLLNSLVKLGWKPFGYKGMKATVNIYGEIRFEKEGHFFIEIFRTLTSKESGLWQFVCENGMIKKPDIDRGEVHNLDNPNHWLCESSLKDESELQDFLLNSIKLD